MNTTTTRTRRATTVRPTTAAPRPEIVVDHSASQRTSLIFIALLGMAAILCLAGIVMSANDSTGVDDAPPTVLVETD